MSKLNFLGKGVDFPFKFSSTGGLKKTVGLRSASDEAKINASLRFILSVQKGERPMLRDFGCNLRSFIFEPNDIQLERAMLFDIRMCILKWEKRIILNNLRVDRTLAKEGKLFLDITYTITKSNVQGNLVYPFYLEDGIDSSISGKEVLFS